MITDFKGKTAFITGGASGIGFQMARAFGRAGMNIVVADIDRDAAGAAVERLGSEQIRSCALSCDVAEEADVRRAANEAVEAFGKVHLLCNNAGVAVGGPVGAVDERSWDWIIDVNLKGVVHGVQSFVPLMRSHGEGGHIVNTASMAGLVSPPGLEPYAATKYAVVAITEGWAPQLAALGISSSVLCPGFVRTRIHESERGRPARYAEPKPNDPALESVRAEAAKHVLDGIDAEIVGARVLEAVKAGEFYIFTHPQMKVVVEARFGAIRAAFDQAAASKALQAVKVWPALNFPL